MKEQIPYSYHTFLFPFLWDKGGEVSRGSFIEALGDSWEEDYLFKENGLNVESAENYALFQYYNRAARRAISLKSDEEKVVCCYRFKDLNMKNHAKYVIVKEDKNNDHEKDEKYELDINAVRLKIYNTGIAIMIYELEFSTDLPSEQARKAVMKINEYGRRLFPPYHAEDNTVLSDSIEIKSDSMSIKDDFRQRLKDRDYLKRPIWIPDIITKLLGESFSETNDRNKHYIEPAIDDRMFVCCCILDEQYGNYFLENQTDSDKDRDESEAPCSSRNGKKWAFMYRWKPAAELYALMNVDAEPDSCSCNSWKVFDAYFEKQLYTRWIEYGTFYGVTNHSFLCITRKTAKKLVADTFLTLYSRMCTLVMAQRASLISFDKETAKTASLSMRKKKYRKKLLNIQEHFAVFQGELLLEEVTSQIQGIELYGMLQDMLFVPQLESKIQNQLGNLSEIVETVRGENLNAGGFCIAISAFLLSLFLESISTEPSAVIPLPFCGCSITCNFGILVGGILAAAISYVMWIIIKKRH